MGCSASAASCQQENNKNSEKNSENNRDHVENKNGGNYIADDNGHVITPSDDTHGGSRNSLDGHDLLSDDQKRGIRNNWKVFTGREVELGRKVFLRIFDQTPQVKDMFPFGRETGDALVNHPMFKSHSLRFVQIIQTGVDSLDNLETGLKPVLLNLGKFHQKRAVWFTAQYFHAFEDAVLFVWEKELGTEFSEPTRNAWTLLFAYIVNGLKQGYKTTR